MTSLSDKISELKKPVSYNNYGHQLNIPFNDTSTIPSTVKYALTGKYVGDDQNVEFVLLDILEKLENNDLMLIYNNTLEPINSRIKNRNNLPLKLFLEAEAKDTTFGEAAEFLLNNLEL